MPYDPKHLKMHPFLVGIVEMAHKKRIEDCTFNTRLSSLYDYGFLYGTDKDGNRASYGNSIIHAMRARLAEPVLEARDNYRSYFFKPYSPTVGANIRAGKEVTISPFASAMDGFYRPLQLALLTVAALGIFGSPYGIIAWVCLPAMKELIAGIVSLSFAVYERAKAVDQEGYDKAAEYLLDATTRFALVIPLAAISMLALPFETVRFFTRSISSLIKLVSGKDVFIPASSQDSLPAGEMGSIAQPKGI